jgi:hypothetical protein
MPRTLHRVLWHLDDFTPFALLAVCSLRKRGVNGSEGIQHCVVESGLIGVDGRGVLSEIVQTGERLAAMAWEGPLARVLPAIVRTILRTKPSVLA